MRASTLTADVVPSKKKDPALVAEYERALAEGNKLIAKATFPEGSIEQIHYWYGYAADLLVQQGTAKHKIVGRLYQDFNQFYGEAWIRMILQKTRNIYLPKDENGDGGEKNAINCENNSSLNTNADDAPSAVQVANAAYIEYLERVRGFLDSYIDLMNEIAVVPELPPQTFSEFLTFANALVTNAKEAIDRRREFKTLKLHVLVEKALLTTINEADYHYSLFVRKEIDTTSKQTRKCIMGWVGDVPPIMEPISRNDAVYHGFSGTPCKQCHSYRTEKQYGVDSNSKDLMATIRCFKCHSVSEPTLSILYKDKHAKVVQFDEHGNAITMRLKGVGEM